MVLLSRVNKVFLKGFSFVNGFEFRKKKNQEEMPPPSS
jgi:hypothetical protein